MSLSTLERHTHTHTHTDACAYLYERMHEQMHIHHLYAASSATCPPAAAEPRPPHSLGSKV
jgi:hypothetical protein